MIREVTHSRFFVGKLEHNSDLLENLTRISQEHDIHLGRVEVIGAVRKARLGFYDQQQKVYDHFEIDGPMEITSLSGNISIKDRQPMVHAHVNLSGADGTVIGGHLAPGTIVFAAEYIIQAFDGPELIRGHDAVTGLPLWDD